MKQLFMEKTVDWSITPRPQMRRDLFSVLNGTWKVNESFAHVPFALESFLSGFAGDLEGHYTYTKTFEVPQEFVKPRILLHFGAVDQIAKVYVNGNYMGEHVGGYLPFTFDISDVVKRGEDNILRVEVTDSLDTTYPYGKQSKKPGGMWYTPISGIWQSVWLENVDDVYIKNLKLTTTMNSLTIELEGVNSFRAIISGITYTFEDSKGTVMFKEPHLWSVDDPYLYELELQSGNDVVHSYFGLREIETKDHHIYLNKKPIFLHGVLDQGYYPEGIYLPNNYATYTEDIQRMKLLGFNTLRKHIKIEAEYFYYACDKLGMLVIQDMVNNGDYNFLTQTLLPTIGFKKHDDYREMDERCKFFIKHSIDSIHHLYSHPCVVMYTIFNEGWGQFNADEVYSILKNEDSTRLYDATSGWFHESLSDVDSEHYYFFNHKPKIGSRTLLVSECGGFVYKIEANSTHQNKSYGYGICKNKEQLHKKIYQMYQSMIIPYITRGCSGCIYTQLSDVEEEVNGLYTFDRMYCKVDEDVMLKIAEDIKNEVAKIK